MEININIEDVDIKFLLDFLKGKDSPVKIEEIARELALFKTVKNREERVKVYDPRCDYKAGDLIYKEYKGKIPVGSKKYVELERGVVLKVVDVRSRFKDEIKLIYEGTSAYKKYTDYLKRQKIELLLPHKMSKPCTKIEYLEPEKDPRMFYDPMLARDFANLKKKMIIAINKHSEIASAGDSAVLIKNMKLLDNEIFNKIRDFLKDSGKSESTEFLVENFVKIKPTDEDFGSFCFSLNYRMKNDYKIDFQQVNYEGWGKWNLISVIYYMKKNSIISEMNPFLGKIKIEDKKGLNQLRKKLEDEIFDEDNTKYYLTQREIYAGALRLRQGVYEIDESIEVELVDEMTKKTYTGYLYSDSLLLMGLKDIFDQYKVLQGSILTLQQNEGNVFFFSIRTTKKGTISDKIEYDASRNIYVSTEEKIASQVFVNKSIYLENDVFKGLEEKIDMFRESDSFNELVKRVILAFGVKERNYEIHILKLYHILDLISPVRLRTVIELLLGNPEFIPSEKLHGVFYLDSNSIVEIEQEVEKSKEVFISQSQIEKEESRKKRIDEEKKVNDEIKQIREERKRKREEEMRKKEEIEKDRELELKKASAPPAGKPERTIRKKAEKTSSEDVFPEPEKTVRKAAPKKKVEKDPFKEKEQKAPKKTVKKSEDDKMDLEDLKSEMELIKLKEKVKEKKKKPAKKEEVKKVAFKDDGGFGGIFASKLEDVVTKEEKPKGKKQKK
ncbi:MAG: hypothetical protein ABFR75_08175 [Acidobacteriota bacterium]